MQLASLGWNQRFAALFVPHASAGLAPGRVLQQFNSIYTVATANGEMRGQLSGHLRFAAAPGELPVTGDWVALRIPPGQSTGRIQAVLPRATLFSRRAAGIPVMASIS
jgi:ribosome biogenesis GTPase